MHVPDADRTPQPAYEPGALLPAGDDSRGSTFPHADDDFGLTPKPKADQKAKSQRVDPLLGMDLGGVKIIRLLGEGGMGRVYEARQHSPPRTVAVKVIRQGLTSEKTMRRFEREAEFLGKLQHPGIAQIHVVGSYSSDIGDVPFFIMEFISDAKPITNFTAETGLGIRETLGLFKQVCEAVSHGHDRGIIHRDLKPGNILIDANGAPKIIDFGVARSTDSDLNLTSMRTDTGALVGTVQYMSPEQFGDTAEGLDGRADVYALGVVLYELLAGVLPYTVRRKKMHDAARIVCEFVPPTLRSVNKSIPRDVSLIAERCLQKDSRYRYRTAGELAADIGRFLAGQPVQARSSGMIRIHQALRKVSDDKTRAVVLLGGLAFGAWWLFRQQAPKPAPQPAPPVSTPTPAVPIPTPRLPEQVSRPRSHTAPRPAPQLEPQHTDFEANLDWVKSGLIVREGDCYTITVTGECQDSTGKKFSPKGPTPRDQITMLGAPKHADDPRTYREFFTLDHPRQMLIAKVGTPAVFMAIGSGLTFISPGDGELEFRLNDGRLTDVHSRGRLSIDLIPVLEPRLVSPDGTTTIVARVADLKYLLFEPDGLRWDYRTVSATNEGDYPTLINGIAWWPQRDPRRSSRSKILPTSLFSWAAGPKAVEPKVVMPPGANRPYAEVKPSSAPDGTRALTFNDAEAGVSEVSCTISRP